MASIDRGGASSLSREGYGGKKGPRKPPPRKGPKKRCPESE